MAHFPNTFLHLAMIWVDAPKPISATVAKPQNDFTDSNPTQVNRQVLNGVVIKSDPRKVRILLGIRGGYIKPDSDRKYKWEDEGRSLNESLQRNLQYFVDGRQVMNFT